MSNNNTIEKGGSNNVMVDFGGLSSKKRRLLHTTCANKTDASTSVTNVVGADPDSTKHQQYPTPKFVDTHLNLLRSLYPSLSSGSHTGNVESDASIVGSIGGWTTIERFLRQREWLFQRKHRASMTAKVHAEALLYMVDRQASLGNAAAEKSTMPQKGLARSAGAISKTTTSMASPSVALSASISKKSRPLSSQVSIATSPHALSALYRPNHSEPSYLNTPTRFHIVANLLKHRHETVQSAFEVEAGPFQSLLTTTNAHIVAQQRILYELQQSLRHHRHSQLSELVATNVYKEGSKQHKHSKDDHIVLTNSERQALRLQMADLECKIRLWSLLARDLRETFAIDP